MAVIVYRKYTFKEPAPITNDQYMYLKQQIAASTKFEINSEFKGTWTSHYKKTMRWFLIGLAAGVVLIILYKVFFEFIRGQFGAPEFALLIPAMAGGATALFMLIRILLEGPSMATYLTERQLYFIRMKYAIRHYPDYPTFYTSFYGDGKKNMSGINAPFRQEALQEQKQAPVTMDRFLTRAFYLIDQHLWKLILVIIAIVLIKKYLLK